MQDKLPNNTNFFPNSPLGLYLHVPFCAKPCAYCQFYKKTPSSNDIDLYLNSVSQEIKSFFSENPSLSPITVFLGGGTPSFLSEKYLQKLLSNFENFNSIKEFTVEVSPSTITKPKLDILRNFGVNRISMGAQSFSEKTLKNLGRTHSLKSTLNAIELISNNFQNFNIDLIFGEKNQSIHEWQNDLDIAVKLPVSHISAYCLEFENGISSCSGKGQNDISKEREADFMETAMSFLHSNGFSQYEVSNYSKKDFQCLHNLNTWRMEHWIGFGPAAASQIFNLRRRNPYDLNLWADSVINKKYIYEDVVYLNNEELYLSSLIFGLRMRNGVNLNSLQKKFPNTNIENYSQKIKNLIQENLLIIEDNQIIKLTPKSILIADSIAEYLLD